MVSRCLALLWFHALFILLHNSALCEARRRLEDEPSTEKQPESEYAVTGRLADSKLVHRYPVKAPCCIDPKRIPIRDLDSLFYIAGQCPVDTSPEAICELASLFYARKATRLAPLTQKNHYGEPAPEPAVLVSKHSEHYFEVFKKTDLAVVTNGGCFNVISNVLPGDRLTANCFNPVVGDQRRFSEVFSYYNFVIGGELVYKLKLPLANIAGAGAIGGDFFGEATVRINILGKLGGPFALSPLCVGGLVLPTTRGVQQNIFASPFGPYSPRVGAGDPAERIVPHYRPIGPIEVEELRTEIEVFTCALSKSIQDTPPAGTIEVRSKPLDALNIKINCGDLRNCVVTLPEPVIVAAEIPTRVRIISHSNNLNVVKINWPGTAVRITLDLQVYPPTYPIIWNFFEAEEVHLFTIHTEDLTTDWYGSVVAPRATYLVLEAPMGGPGFFGTLLVGPRESKVRINNFQHFDLAPAPCPPSSPSIVFCRCLCGDEDDKDKSPSAH